MSTTVVEFENQDVIVVEMSGRGPIGPRGRQGEPGPAGPSEWGVIQGNISDQTDLQNALDAKANVGVSYTKAEDDALLAQKADADSVYTKTETDSLLSDKADADDVYSKTEVNTLLSGKADADTVYTKTETDTLLDAKADVGDSYTKAEEDTLLNAKANSADVYTKTETDTLLADKADADDVYTKDEVDDALADKADSADVYTKTETDSLLQDKAPVILSSASGSIASFSDGSASPVTALTVGIEPVQDLHGYDNPWPAGGGANKLNYDTLLTWKQNGNDLFSLSGNNLSVLTNDTTAFESETRFIALTAGTYTLSADNNARMQIGWNGTKQVDTYNTKSISFTLPEDRSDIHIKFSADSYPYNLGKVQITAGTTIPTWTPYSNICPISGHTSATVTRTGKNLCNVDDENVTSAYIDGRGRIMSNSSWTTSVLIPVESGKPYCLSGLVDHPNTNTDNYRLYDKNKSYLSYIQKNIVNNPYPITFADGVAFVQFCWKNTDKSTVMFEQSSISSSFKPYQGQQVTIDLDGTRYGGVLNLLTGEMTVDRVKLIPTIDYSPGTNAHGITNWRFSGSNFNNTSAIKRNNISNYFTYQETVFADTSTEGFTISNAGVGYIRLKAERATTVAEANTWVASNDFYMVIYLATPFTVQLSPSQMQTLLGQNNIWADTGDVSVEYRADTKLFIEGQVTQTAKVTRQMIADSATADGKAPKSLATGDLIIVGDELRKATANIGNGSAITASNSTIATLADVIKALQ